MTQPRLLGISGSLRAGSTNTLLLKEAARLFGDASFTLADIRMPLYDGDLETAEGMPAEAAQLHEQMAAADAIIFATPEYNSNLPGVLKNALDWVSRKAPKPMEGKPVAIMSAAAGRTGGARSQFSLRHCLTPFRPRVMQGPEMMVASSQAAFAENGRLRDEKSQEILAEMMADLRAMIDA